MKSAPIEKMKGGNIFLFSFAFLLRKKKAADETPIITHKPRNIGKMFSALFSILISLRLTSIIRPKNFDKHVF